MLLEKMASSRTGLREQLRRTMIFGDNILILEMVGLNAEGNPWRKLKRERTTRVDTMKEDRGNLVHNLRAAQNIRYLNNAR